MPALLLLVARDLLLYDPPRVLAWRVFHDPRLAGLPAWLSPLLPGPAETLDRDPVALLLGAIAAGCAILYLAAAVGGCAPRVRGVLVVFGGTALVAAPTLAFVAMGLVTGRPYGQDGGVVQLPLAMDKILSGESPYGADYSDSILGKEARVSDFWAAWGGANPILHHHAYLPGTHLLTMPFYLVARAAHGAFDARGVTFLAYALAMLLAARLVGDPDRRLAAAAVVAVNPLVYWHQVFGANDAMIVALVLLAVLLAERGRPTLSAATLGLACATKQLAWPFAAFLLVHLSGVRGFGELLGRDGLRRLARPSLVAGAVFAAVVAPVAALDPGRFWADIVAYNVGLPGIDNYPLGGTPGFGFANFLIYFGRAESLKDYFPFGIFYALLVPLGLLLVRHQMQERRAGTVLVTGSAALLAALYFSRVVHPNYLVIAAVLLPIGFLMGERLPADVAAIPLLLLAVAVEVADHELFRTTWEDALAVRLPQNLTGLAAVLAPRAASGLTRDPLGLVISALAAGLGVVYVVAGVLRASCRLRLALVVGALVVVVVVPTLVVVNVGRATGQVRAQDPWTASVAVEAHRAAGRALAVAPREAWSSSFRRDPPAALTSKAGAGAAVGWVLGHLGALDPRLASLLAVALSGVLLGRLAGADDRPLVLGAALLSPIAAEGVTFGSGGIMLLAAALVACLLGGSGRAAAAGLVMTLALVAFSTVLAPAPATLEPGLGFPNVLLYWGAGPRLSGVAWLAPWAALLGCLLAWPRLRARAPLPALFAAALLLMLCLAGGVSPHDLLAPFSLLVLSATRSDDSRLPAPRPGP